MKGYNQMMLLSILILVNMISTKYIAIPTTMLVVSLQVFVDTKDMVKLDGPLTFIILMIHIAWGLQYLLAVFFITFMLHTAEIELIKSWNLKEVMHRELADILDNLETAIITKNHGRIGLCNEPGTSILHSIYHSLDLEQPNFDFCMKRVLKAKVFKIFEDKHASKKTGMSSSDDEGSKFDTLYSLTQIFKWDITDLSSKIFNIVVSNSDPSIYYQLRRQKIWNGDSHYDIL